MIDYRSGDWGFHVALGWRGSLAPRALTMAIPNAVITFVIANWFIETEDFNDDTSKKAQLVITAGGSVMLFILYNRSRTSYNRWWEGGTLLQKARGEWFNAFSSIMAFTSTKPEIQQEVDCYVHLTARLMSLLMCCALQQVSPNRNRPFEIIGLEGIEPDSMEFLNSAPDKVEIILQWIQRSMVLHMHTGVLPAPPPILSRAFQEVSRGIVNLQNARKIADFPYPYPLAQVSMILQILHWAITPIASSMAVPMPYAVTLSFLSIFVLWCIHFNAIELEFPFGTRANDLPMNEFQCEWNISLLTLCNRKAQRPPKFDYDPAVHDELLVQMSDASDLYIPATTVKSNRSSVSRILIKSSGKRKRSWYFKPEGRFSVHKKQLDAVALETQTSYHPFPGRSENHQPIAIAMVQGSDTLQLTTRRERTTGTSSGGILSARTSNITSVSNASVADNPDDSCNVISGLSSESLGRVVLRNQMETHESMSPRFPKRVSSGSLAKPLGLEPLVLDGVHDANEST